jgi:hypothetical protein
MIDRSVSEFVLPLSTTNQPTNQPTNQRNPKAPAPQQITHTACCMLASQH